MTTCLRSSVLNWHPKLSLIKARSSTSFSGAPRPQSSFFNEFPDPGTGESSSSSSKRSHPPAADASFLPACPWTEVRSLVPVRRIVAAPKMAMAEEVSASKCHSYDPRLRTTLCSPADDIILTCSKNVSSFLEDDLRRDVYQRDIYLVEPLNNAPLPARVGAWHRQCSPLSDYEKSMILSSEAEVTGKPKDSMGKPTEAQLQQIFLTLSDNLPKFFTHTLDYNIYHSQLVFQNNIRGVTTHGLATYIRQMSLLRIIGHLKFAYVQMEVLKVTKHEEDGTIRVRWRIRGIPGYKIIFQFWKFHLWNFKELLKFQSDWYDAFSTFYVGGDGLVHRHVCDKMMRDEQREKTTGNLAAKLALLLGAIPRPSADDLGAMVLALTKLQNTTDVAE